MGSLGRIVVDIVNVDTTAEKVNPVLKIKPLYGFGRVDFSFVLRQQRCYSIQVSLELSPEAANQFPVFTIQSDLAKVMLWNIYKKYHFCVL